MRSQRSLKRGKGPGGPWRALEREKGATGVVRKSAGWNGSLSRAPFVNDDTKSRRILFRIFAELKKEDSIIPESFSFLQHCFLFVTKIVTSREIREFSFQRSVRKPKPLGLWLIFLGNGNSTMFTNHVLNLALKVSLRLGLNDAREEVPPHIKQFTLSDPRHLVHLSLLLCYHHNYNYNL